MAKLNVVETKVLRNERDSKPRIFVFTKDADTRSVIENAGYTPNYVYRRAEVVKAGLLALGLSENTKVSWSRTAGCSCGCSPGFIVDTLSNPNSAYLTVQA